jgi:hypothetical protein
MFHIRLCIPYHPHSRKSPFKEFLFFLCMQDSFLESLNQIHPLIRSSLQERLLVKIYRSQDESHSRLFKTSYTPHVKDLSDLIKPLYILTGHNQKRTGQGKSRLQDNSLLHSTHTPCQGTYDEVWVISTGCLFKRSSTHPL